MSEFKENLNKVERLLKIAQTREEHTDCNNLYDFLGIDKTASKEEIKASIGEKYKFYLAKQNVNGWEILTKIFISSQPAIEYILFECKPEYDNYLLVLKVKDLRKQFISCTSADHEFDAKAKKEIIKQGLDIGLSETQISKIMDRWMEEYGVKLVDALPSSDSSSNDLSYNELLGKTYHEIFGLPNDADYSETSQIIKIIDRWMEKDGVKPAGASAPSDSVSDYLPHNEFSGKTYYEIFGISKDADYSEIKRIYVEEQEKYVDAQDEARWLLISEGWEVLKDKDKREAYDKKINKQEAELEDGGPVLKVISMKAGPYVYKNVKKGASFIETIVIKNGHKGRLQGRIISDAEWLVPGREYLSYENEQTLEIHIVTSKLPVNAYDAKGTITIDTNGGPLYLIPFKVILEELEIAADKFRKTYIPLTAACAGFIGSFSGSPFSDILVSAVFAGVMTYAIAKFIVKASLKNGLNIFKFPFTLIQGAAGGIVILTILSHSSVSSVSNRKVEQEKADAALRPESQPVSALTQSEQLQLLPETEKTPVIKDRADHNQLSSLSDDTLTKGTIALSGSLTNVDSKAVGIGDFWRFGFEAMSDKAHYGFGCSNYDELYFRINGNDVDRASGLEAMRARPNRVTLYFHAQNWDFVQKCSKGSRCAGSACPLAIVVEANTNAQSTLYQSPLTEVLKSSSVSVEAGRKNTRPAANIAQKKKWKPKTSSFAPPSRDDL